MMFNSRGFKDAAAKKGAELEAALLKASENGGRLAGVGATWAAGWRAGGRRRRRRQALALASPQASAHASLPAHPPPPTHPSLGAGKWPIVCDTSPCLAQVKAGLSDPALR